MPDFDSIIRNGNIVGPHAITQADLGIREGRIASIRPSLKGTASSERDASNLHIFPGVIDSHVHFNDPGRADWEGIATGSRALAAGGGTLFFDMPLNAHPPTNDAASFDLKLASAKANSFTDYAFWGGLVPGNLDCMDDLVKRGVIGFKAFMCNSGIEDFACVDLDTLRAGMKRAAELDSLVAVHAESESLTSQLTQQKLRAGQTSIRDYLDSRPIQAELEAIQRAIDLAAETACRLHIVHVSSSEGVALVTNAKSRGVDVSCETCPHYLTLTEDDMLRLGAVAKCAPPLRPESSRAKLAALFASDQIDTVGSDHSPAPPEMKTDQIFFNVWGGISSVQHTLPLILNLDQNLSRASRVLASNVVKRFRLPETLGQIIERAEANLALVDLDKRHTIDSSDIFYRHRHTPYAGRPLTSHITATILRGQTIYENGQFLSALATKLIHPK